MDVRGRGISMKGNHPLRFAPGWRGRRSRFRLQTMGRGFQKDRRTGFLTGFIAATLPGRRKNISGWGFRLRSPLRRSWEWGLKSWTRKAGDVRFGWNLG